MPQGFVHLHLHTEYSLIDGITRIKPLVQAAVAQTMPAIAMTDQSNIFAAVKFYQQCLAQKIKPILGADVWLINPEQAPFRVTLLCQNNIGYRHLVQLISRAHTEGQQHEFALVQYEWLAELSEGLIVLSGGVRGDVGQALLRDDQALVLQRLQFWQQHFPQRFYIELTRTGRENEAQYIRKIMPLAAELQIPVVATNDVCFLTAKDFDAHEARVCIHEGYQLNDPRRTRLHSEQQYFRSTEEMLTLFADIPQALENTLEIAKRCTVTMTLGESFLPQFPVPAGMTVENYLELQAEEGLKQRLLFNNIAAELQQPYFDRLKMELGVINKMGFPGYFLIVADFIQWAKNNDVPVGPGRGSGAGSIVAYALKITDLDPLPYELLFERFLNPERVSMPDFDIDFCMEGRDRVIDYVAQKYGRTSVSQIITFGTMAARAVVRDVGRALGFAYGFVDKIAKMIPFEIGITLEKALEEDDLKKRYKEEEEVRNILDLAQSLEGITRNVGKHAGGVVIAPGDLTNYTALYCEPDGSNLVSQFDKDDVESIGLVKFDFLGLRNLTIINWALKTINARRAKEGLTALDIAALPLDDEKTYQLLRECKTTAVFQLESRGMKDLIAKLQPTCFDDIVPLVALFRPGPLQSGMVDDFINCRHGRARTEYLHPKLEPILKPTYGVILYQEQVMQIAQVLAGYSLGTADLLRRAMGKKKPEEMAKQRIMFVEGSVERGVVKAQAEKIFDLMENFAGYGFNKSHSAAYGLIAYQTAYLKAHYPAEFMAAVLSSDMDNTDKVVKFFDDCEQLGLKILPPDINSSQYKFTVNEQGEILYGLGAINGVGEAAIEVITEQREKSGIYRDLFDFCSRNDMRKVNKRVLEGLIKSGAMDCFGVHRAMLLANLPAMMQAAEQQLQSQAASQHDLFGELASDTQQQALELISVKEWTEKERLQAEKDTLGLYLSGHPISQYLEEFSHFTSGKIAQLKPRLNEKVIIAGLVATMRSMLTKRGDRMAFISLDDGSAAIELAVFADVFKDCKELLQSDAVIVVEGEVSVDDYSGGYRVSCKRVMSITQARENFAKYLLITLPQAQAGGEFSQRLAEILKPFRGGPMPVQIKYQRSEANAVIALDRSWQIHPTDELLLQLQELLSKEAIQVVY